MKRLFIVFATFFVAHLVCAQQVKEEIMQNPCLSASNYLAYPGPSQKTLTPAPKGYKPFYISHYGRHGSRYLIGDDEYDKPLEILNLANKQGKLTPLGQDVLRRVKVMAKESRKRLGELTPLGAQQHKDIARRMYERFPEVFKGDAKVDAKSTVVIRCILSMENALQQLVALNPKLRITHDASEHDMYFMNHYDKTLVRDKKPDGVMRQYQKYREEHLDYTRLMESLFNDKDYVYKNVDADDFGYRLFKLASNLQSIEARKEMTLYDIFTQDELYANWQMENVRWYIETAACPLNGGTQPFVQSNLMKNIIAQADSCINASDYGATLRFGHETMVLQIACLMGINGYDVQVSDFGKIEESGWINYKLFPMGANVQFVFYRRNADDKDVLVKVLLNENEATLPLPSDTKPYYRWTDFKNFFNDKLSSYSQLKHVYRKFYK